MVRIVVVDGHTLNPGDLSWDELSTLADCTVFDRTPPEEIVARIGDAELVLTNKAALSAETIEQLPKLQYIGISATGFDNVDVEAARRRRIPVSNVPVYGSRSVAQMVFAHLLNLTQHVAHHARTVVEGRWGACEDFSYWDYPMVELAGQTMGIVGFGRIGRTTAQLALAFGMNVLGCDVTVPADAADVEMVELDELFRRSDVVSLHCPLTPETERLVDARRLGMMKDSAFLINTSRGPLVDEHALAEALNSGRLAGAGLDVLVVEPPKADNLLLSARNCFVTPHIAWATRAARARLLQASVDNVRAFLDGSPQNVVNP